MAAALLVVKSELRLFEKTRNPLHLAHAQRALRELMDEARCRLPSDPSWREIVARNTDPDEA